MTGVQEVVLRSVYTLPASFRLLSLRRNVTCCFVSPAASAALAATVSYDVPLHTRNMTHMQVPRMKPADTRANATFRAMERMAVSPADGGVRAVPPPVAEKPKKLLGPCCDDLDCSPSSPEYMCAHDSYVLPVRRLTLCPGPQKLRPCAGL